MQLPGGGHPVHAGHLHVQQGHVDVVGLDRVEHLVAPAHLGHHRQVGFQVEQGGHRAADQGLVVGQQQFDHEGTSTRTRKPG